MNIEIGKIIVCKKDLNCNHYGFSCKKGDRIEIIDTDRNHKYDTKKITAFSIKKTNGSRDSTWVIVDRVEDTIEELLDYDEYFYDLDKVKDIANEFRSREKI